MYCDQVHTDSLILIQHFSYFWRVHTQYILIQSEYVLWVPDSIACQPGPWQAWLHAIDSGTTSHSSSFNHYYALAPLPFPCPFLAGGDGSRGRSFVNVGVERDLGFLDPPTHWNPSTENQHKRLWHNWNNLKMAKHSIQTGLKVKMWNR